MKPTSVLALALATSATFAQSPIAGIDLRLARFFTSTADANFVTNFVNTAPSGGLPIFALDYDASATTLVAVNNTTLEYGTLDVLTATFTPIGVIGLGITGVSGLTASPNGTTWYLSSIVGPDTNLYVANIAAGTFSLVGSMVGAGQVIDISMSSTGRLIAHSITTDSFYDVDPGTAVATLIGPHGLAANFAQGMDFDWSTDTLYATIYTGGGTGQFCTVNLTTGAVTPLVATTPLNAEMEIAIRVPAPPPGLVTAGSDFWTTPAGASRYHFDTVGIPAGFFGPGSQAFFGIVELRGDPLSGTGLTGGVDTIVQRNAPAMLPGVGSSANVPIEIVALSLVSVQPIAINFGTGTSQYEMRVSLSSSMPQQPGGMICRQTDAEGGWFGFSLPVLPRLQFRKVAGQNGVNNAIHEPSSQFGLLAPGPGLLLPCWSFNDGGFNLASSPGGQVDHDGDPITPDRPFLATSPNFHMGICIGSLLGGNCPPQIMLTEAEDMPPTLTHGVLPPRIPMLVGTNYCNPANPNSTGCRASIYGLGSDRVLDNNLTLEARGMPLNSFGFFLASRGQLNPPIIPVGSQGRLCVGPSIGRGVGGVIFNSGATGTAAVLANLLAMPLPTGPVAVLPGETWFFQGWHRDANPGVTSNLTNGLRVLFH